MSDYSFMKTGNMSNNVSNDIDEEKKKEIINNALSLGVSFLEDGMELARMYSSHANRYTIKQEDMFLAMKARVYYGKKYWEKSGIIMKFEDGKNNNGDNNNDDGKDNGKDNNDCEMEEVELESDDHFSDNESIDDDEEFTLSECECRICGSLNGIDEKWDKWEPTIAIDKICKGIVNRTIEEISKNSDENYDLFEL